jgi:hypothetical protein
MLGISGPCLVRSSCSLHLFSGPLRLPDLPPSSNNVLCMKKTTSYEPEEGFAVQYLSFERASAFDAIDWELVEASNHCPAASNMLRTLVFLAELMISDNKLQQPYNTFTSDQRPPSLSHQMQVMAQALPCAVANARDGPSSRANVGFWKVSLPWGASRIVSPSGAAWSRPSHKSRICFATDGPRLCSGSLDCQP